MVSFKTKPLWKLKMKMEFSLFKEMEKLIKCLKHAWKCLENIESSYLRMNQAQRLVSKRLDQVRKKLKIKSI